LVGFAGERDNLIANSSPIFSLEEKSAMQQWNWLCEKRHVHEFLMHGRAETIMAVTFFRLLELSDTRPYAIHQPSSNLCGAKIPSDRNSPKLSRPAPRILYLLFLDSRPNHLTQQTQ
jgi:hypothetical protein